MFSKFLDPKNDFAFKKVFGTEKNKDILIHFLNDILDSFAEYKIQTVSFLKPAQDPEIASKKQSILDVLCVDERGCQYIVEMQVARTTGFEKRAQYYAAKAYASQMNKGECYENLKEVIFLAITNFVMFPKKKSYKSDHVILDKESLEHDLRDFSFCFLELPKFKKPISQLTTMVEKWAYFFKHAVDTSKNGFEQILSADFAIRRAYEVLDRYSWTEQELFTYEQIIKQDKDADAILRQREADGLAKGMEIGMEKGVEIGMEKGVEIGMEKGVEIGMEKGEVKAKEEIARKLFRAGTSIPSIVDITGLLEEEINLLFDLELDVLNPNTITHPEQN